MTDRFTANLSDDEVRVALNAPVVEIRQKQDNIDAFRKILVVVSLF